MKTKYIFVTGGVVSSLGKGLASASIGALLEARGLRVTLQKLDPYINVDPGTMNPYQHGEVYVTDDGAETDLDLGHYERFTGMKASRKNNFTTGSIYYTIISRERKGEYLGGTVQVIPHVTDEIKSRILSIADKTDVAIIEVGGTVGDIEGLPFLEAVRQLRNDLGHENTLFVHLTLIPFIDAAGELKTKPTQHSVMKLREIGIQPDILLCRTKHTLDKGIKSKIALFCNVEEGAVITARDVQCVYEVPLAFHKEGLDDTIIEKLHMWTGSPRLEKWEDLIARVNGMRRETVIGMVGKYVHLTDSYKSLNEALVHGGIANDCRVRILHIDSEEIERSGPAKFLKGADGILIPGGFGARGIEGKIEAVRWAREKKIPFFGICLGMQVASIEFARNVCRLNKANSVEFEPAANHPVIDLMADQRDVKDMGGTMRLGAYPCVLSEKTMAHKAYGSQKIFERHRHRYEFNNKYRDVFAKKGVVFSGLSPDGRLVEIIELKGHPWFLGCQFHPEFTSKPLSPHPLFRDFIRTSSR